MNFKKYKRKLIISKDAGAANMIFHYFKDIKDTYYCYLKNPAKKIFKHKNFIKIKNIKNLNTYDLVITGTSVKNKFELENIRLAKKLGIHTVTFLDHWTNYQKRFVYKKKIILPNDLIVFDKTSHTLSKRIFKKHILKKNLILKRVNNNYLQTVKSKKKNDLLILSSNYDLLKKKNINDAKILLNFFKKNYLFFKKKKICNYFLKNHPSENKRKFVPLIKIIKNQFDINLKVVNKDLKNITKTTKHVIGYNTMALVIAKLSGCTTYEIKIKRIKSDIPSNYIDRNI